MEAAQLLERDLTIQVGLAGGVHDRHAAATNLAQDLVATDRAHEIKVSRDGPADNRWATLNFSARPTELALGSELSCPKLMSTV